VVRSCAHVHSLGAHGHLPVGVALPLSTIFGVVPVAMPTVVASSPLRLMAFRHRGRIAAAAQRSTEQKSDQGTEAGQFVIHPASYSGHGSPHLRTVLGVRRPHRRERHGPGRRPRWRDPSFDPLRRRDPIMSTTAVVILITVVLVVGALAIGGWLIARRRALQHRFGPEYDRVVAQQPSRGAAEQELREREHKHAELELRTLAPQVRARYAAEWVEVQAHFIDSPGAAVDAGDALLTRLISDIGYPTDSDGERLALLSVDHAGTLGHYREAHEISVRNAHGQASTEQLRQALVHFRALIADLLGEQPVPSAHDPLATRPVATGSAGDATPSHSVPATRTP
jgi:hypothetical protein